MRGRELYGHYHRLIDELAQLARPGDDWQGSLRASIERFEADAGTLESASAQLLREDLCAQFEHEALRSTNPHAQEVLVAAVKWLELGS